MSGTELAIDALGLASIPPAAVKNSGYVAALGYLRNLTPQVVNAYLSAGLGVGTIFETAADEALGGTPLGSADGAAAAKQARSLGQPPGTILFVNLGDFAISAAEIPSVIAYYKAFRVQAAQYAVGAYATGYGIIELAAAGLPGPWWQNAIDDNGVPGSVVTNLTALYQRVSPTVSIPGQAGNYDENVQITPLPWWSTGGVPVASQGLPASAYPIQQVVPITGGPNPVEVYMLGKDGHVYHKWFSNGTWNGYDIVDGATP